METAPLGILDGGRSITIYERRPPWPGAPDPDGPWTKREIAQFRCEETSAMWTLHWADRNGRCLRVPDVAPALHTIHGKILIIEREWQPDRTTVVLVREPIGV